MQLSTLDLTVIAVCLGASLTAALVYSRRAARGTSEFFASGRAAPWWLAGTSMVATTFSTDTPNLVTDFVRGDGGVASNWQWWAFLLTGMMTVFFYARLWRRSGVLTDLEFYELRYGGKPAAFVRGFRAIYLGLAFNCVIMATVTLAAVKIANVMLGWDRFTTIVVCSVVCVAFSALSGLWGVLASDIIQFVIAMAGVLFAAKYSLAHPDVGGLEGLFSKLDPQRFALLPDFGNTEQLFTLLVIPLAVQWWAFWYPGAEPGGGSYIAQRMLAARSESDAVAATLWFNVAHYALRPWPWIIVALCSLIVFPEVSDIREALPGIQEELLGNDIAYPAMLTLLPHGILGLLIASLASAYVSTMSTHLNWGASYLVHDFYRRFVRNDATESHYILVSRLVTAALMVASASLVYVLSTASEGFDLLMKIGAGTGLIYLLRWYWWRINAWGEIAAMAASLVAAVGSWVLIRYGFDAGWATGLIGSVVLTTLAWLVTTLVTAPEKKDVLQRFYRRIQPPGPGWKAFRSKDHSDGQSEIANAFIGWFAGCIGVYAALFGTGYLLFGNYEVAALCGAVFVVAGFIVTRKLRLGTESAMTSAEED